MSSILFIYWFSNNDETFEWEIAYILCSTNDNDGM